MKNFEEKFCLTGVKINHSKVDLFNFALENFIKHLKFYAYSVKTFMEYDRILKAFRIATGNLPLDEISYNEIYSFLIDACKKQQNGSNSGKNKKISAIKIFKHLRDFGSLIPP